MLSCKQSQGLMDEAKEDGADQKGEEGKKLQKSDDSLHLSVSLSQNLYDNRL